MPTDSTNSTKKHIFNHRGDDKDQPTQGCDLVKGGMWVIFPKAHYKCWYQCQDLEHDSTIVVLIEVEELLP